jgi:uncharacterized integral membrane protein
MLLLAVVVALGGVVFSAINVDPAVLDLYVGRVTLPLGVLVLAALLLGFVLAGLVLWTGVIVPLRIRLAAARREAQQRAQAPAQAPR